MENWLRDRKNESKDGTRVRMTEKVISFLYEKLELPFIIYC